MYCNFNSTVFWVVTPCNTETAKRFGVIYHFHLHGVKTEKTVLFIVIAVRTSDTTLICLYTGQMKLCLSFYICCRVTT
jgi:hypothetical protein